MPCCGTSNKLHMKECEFLNRVSEDDEFLNLIQQCKNDQGTIDPEALIKQMEHSSNAHLKDNADAVRKKLKNFLPKDKTDQKHVLEEDLLLHTLKSGMQDAIDKTKK